tara:strand:+ start:394 stop:1059 length:666 start_codon:yes stop_codon:yes gene_type:complete
MTVAISNLSATWTDSANTYNAISMNVSNSGASGDSKLLDLKVNGVSQMSVSANGMINVSTIKADIYIGIPAGDLSIINSNTVNVAYTLRSNTITANTSIIGYTTITQEFTAGEILADGNLCYYNSDGKMWKADALANTTSKGLLGMCTEAISADATGTFTMFGNYTATGLTTGSVYYVSETGGAITVTPPTTSAAVVRVVGYATSTTNLFIFPSGAWVEIA